MNRIRLRHESRPGERRTALVPSDAATLLRSGVRVTVEESPQRGFPTADYVAAGCALAPAGSWMHGPPEEIVLGLKELPGDPATLPARHVFFGHAYKGQPGARSLLRRFVDGGGTLLDLEYLTDDTGQRIAAFGFWAGYVGAALAVLHARGVLRPPLFPTTRARLEEALAQRPAAGADPSVLVVGALGRCGRGALAALEAAGLRATCWDLAETQDLDRDALLAHDVLVHCVGGNEPAPPLLRPQDLDRPGRRLRLISDVTCDIGSDYSLLPLHDRTTTWDNPVLALPTSAGPPVEVVALDNLPSLVPVEASTAFSTDLLPYLAHIDEGPVWARARTVFDKARTALTEGATT